MMNTASLPLYDADFYAWTQQQANALKAEDFSSLDLDNLIDEIESMGKSEKRELDNQLEVLLAHLLKWQFQPNFRGKIWQLTIIEQRKGITYHLMDNPSLKSRIPETYERIYTFAVMDAVKETGMAGSTFPAECPWTFD